MTNGTLGASTGKVWTAAEIAEVRALRAAEAEERGADIIITPVQPSYSPVQQAVEVAQLQAIADAQTTQTQPTAITTAGTSTEPQKFLLEIGYIGNPPSWLGARIMNTLQPIAQRIGWTVEMVAVNPTTIDVRFAAPANPIPMILIYCILAVIAAAIAGAVIISINWRDIRTQEIETKQISDLSEVIAGIAADPNIDQATKTQMLLDLNKSIGGVVQHEEPAFSIAGIKDLMLLGIVATVISSVIKK